MKKLLMSAIVLSCLAISLTLFQMSCKKEATAQTSSNYILPSATTSSLGGIIVGPGLSVTTTGVLSASSGSSNNPINKVVFVKNSNPLEIWTCNYDGTSAAKVNIVLPNGVSFSNGLKACISPNGQKIFFTAGASGSSTVRGDLYVCNYDGSSVTKIYTGAGTDIVVQGAY